MGTMKHFLTTGYKEGEMSDLKGITLEIRNGFFADRKTLREAMDFAYELINNIEGPDRIAAITALQVVLNTIANELEVYENERETT